MYHLGRGVRDSEIQNVRFCFYNNSYFNEIIFCLSFYIVFVFEKHEKNIYKIFEKENIIEIKTIDNRCLHVAALFVTQWSKKAIVNGSNIPEPLLMMF